MALNVFTAVLIIACPCALALSAPFTLGNLLRIFGKKGFYLKNTQVIERLAKVNTAIFDKTGTITSHKKSSVHFDGDALSDEEQLVVKSVLRSSMHPLNRAIYGILEGNELFQPDDFEEFTGEGIEASIGDTSLKLGSSSFLGMEDSGIEKTRVHLSIDNRYKGSFVFNNEYRPSTQSLFNKLAKTWALGILSGDNDGEEDFLRNWLPKGVNFSFNQTPNHKLAHIKGLQDENKKVLMVGDGLNDAGALAQSDVGFAISEDVNVFSPACDGIIDAKNFGKLHELLLLSKKGMKIIRYSLGFSVLYNLIGLGFAVTGHLSPLVAAILMPLSSISIVVFTTVATNWASRKFSANALETDKNHVLGKSAPIHLKPNPAKV